MGGFSTFPLAVPKAAYWTSNAKASKLERSQSLYSDHHGVGTNQLLDTSFSKTAFSHPSLAISARVVKSAGRFYQHVQTHEQAEDVFAAFVVDHGVVNDHCASAWDCLERFAEQCSLSIDIPIMQDMAHEMTSSIGSGWQRSLPPQISRGQTALGLLRTPHKLVGLPLDQSRCREDADGYGPG